MPRLHLPSTFAILLLGLSHRATAAGSHPGTDKYGAVASESAVCSHIGVKLLEKGGNAVDALVGTTFCVGVIGMYHSGIGGGGFALVRDPLGSYEFVDFRETAAAAYSQDMFVGNPNASLYYSGLASGVPGEVRGLEYIHHKYGALPWEDVMAPAIKVARSGFEVTADTIRYMASTANASFLTEDPSWATDFAPNGTLVQLGQTMTRKRYADTLEAIATDGPAAFYTGRIANATIAALQAANGTMTLADLANYTIALREPLSIRYRDYKLTSCSAPSGGETMLALVNILNGYDGFADPAQTNLSTHRLSEAMRWAFGMRTRLGDPSFVANMSAYQASMLSAATAEAVRAKISDTETFNVSYYDPGNIEVLSDAGTSHVVAADRSGLAVTVITTINTLFGSRVMVPETGVIMNNQMNDFAIPGTTNAFGYEPAAANYIVPGKRPLSSMSPAIVEYPDGGVYFLSGSAGGSRIITATAQLILHVVDRNMTSLEALTQPRMHDQLSPDFAEFEYAYNNETTAFMQRLGHHVRWVSGASTAQALRRTENGTFEAAGEPRQEASGGFAV